MDTSLNEIEQKYLLLKRAGHAVLLDEHYNSEGKRVLQQIHHYLTCKRCLELKRAETK